MKTDDVLVLPRWVYIFLAALTACIGLAASGVTAKFFVLGLDRLESDPMARSVLMLTGMLMIVTELAAFGIAALLPAQKLRSMRTLLLVSGALLLAFEVATIFVTQTAVDQANESEMASTSLRVQELQASIEGRRAAANSLRANGERQSASSSAWTRTLGANAFRDALKVEEEIAPLAQELAKLRETTKPTMSTVLGAHGTMVYGLARGLLISAMGLVMFSVAGALLREGMNGNAKQAVDAGCSTKVRVLHTGTAKTRNTTLHGLWGVVVATAGKAWCRNTPEIPRNQPVTLSKSLRRA